MSSIKDNKELLTLKFKLFVSKYLIHQLQNENEILLSEVDFLSDTEHQLREQLSNQYKNFHSVSSDNIFNDEISYSV